METIPLQAVEALYQLAQKQGDLKKLMFAWRKSKPGTVLEHAILMDICDVARRTKDLKRLVFAWAQTTHIPEVRYSLFVAITSIVGNDLNRLERLWKYAPIGSSLELYVLERTFEIALEQENVDCLVVVWQKAPVNSAFEQQVLQRIWDIALKKQDADKLIFVLQHMPYVSSQRHILLDFVYHLSRSSKNLIHLVFVWKEAGESPLRHDCEQIILSLCGDDMEKIIYVLEKVPSPSSLERQLWRKMHTLLL